MKGIVLITGVANAFDENLAAAFVREGYGVYVPGGCAVQGAVEVSQDFAEAAKQMAKEPGKVDYLVDTSDARDSKDTFTARDGIDAAVVEALYRRNVLRPMAALEAFLPLLEAGEGKRLFYLTSASASMNETRDINHYGYNMSKAALHQFLQMTRNKLAAKGYTFRAYDPMPGAVCAEAAAEGAFLYIVRRRAVDQDNALRDDEENLIFRDAQGRQHAW